MWPHDSVGVVFFSLAQAIESYQITYHRIISNHINIWNARSRLATLPWIYMWCAAIQRTRDLVEKTTCECVPMFQLVLSTNILNPEVRLAMPQWISMWCAAIHRQRTCDLVLKQHVSVAPCFGWCCFLTGPGNGSGPRSTWNPESRLAILWWISGHPCGVKRFSVQRTAYM